MIPHQGIVNRLLWMQAAYGLTAEDRVLQKTPFSFDVSLWELFWPLVTGARLVFARPEGHKDPAYLADLMEREGITTLHFVPSMLQVFLEEPELPAFPMLRQVMASGEALPPDLVRRFYSRIAGARLHNLYGPTEASVDVSFWACEPESARVPIGRPISNLSLYVADRNLLPQPLGVPGELLLGGVGLARGYLGRPDLTAAAFVPNPFGEEPGNRLYRTGDLSRTLPDGTVEYLGRIDHQVKIRGVRIEPGEIEALLSRFPGVAAAAVVVSPASARRLAAFVVPPTGTAADLTALRHRLQTQVPEPMVPAVWITLESLPLTANGKVDRRALVSLAEEHGSGREQGAAVAPRTQAEEILAGIWSEVLGIPALGVLDDFFELGGHSLLATQVMSRIRQAFGVDLPLRQLFQSPTVAGLAARVEAELRHGATGFLPPLAKADRAKPLPLSFAQERLWFLHQLDPGSPAYNIPAAVRLTGALEDKALERCLREVVRRHESLRTTFEAIEGRPVQRIALGLCHLPVVDLSALEDVRRNIEVRGLALAEAQRPFDLQTGPVLRAALLRLEKGNQILLVTMHHITSDGWSIGVLVNEIAALYPAFAAGRPSPLEELPLQYADFAVWQRGWLRGDVLEILLGYWRERLAGAPPALALPLDRPRLPVASGRGGFRELRLRAERKAALAALGRKAGATPFMVLLAGWAALLGRLTQELDVLVGTPVANRTRSELEELIGFFVNTLVLRTDLGARPGFRELINRVRESALGAFTHQDLPFERLVEELAPERSLGQTPLFQVMFALQNGPAGGLALPELTLEPLGSGDPTARFDLSLTFWDEGPELAARLVFNRDVFDAVTAARLMESLDLLLEAAGAEPDPPLDDLPLLPRAARAQLIR
ncbi:MAG TPA: condensation domain-containing protein, partial [Thermoanaerobaculia bacterium]|nr:condensation domain-containing protein [Thermoanaerobaculia bacterium]